MSAFTTGNYHCKPLMTDVTVIHQVNMYLELVSICRNCSRNVREVLFYQISLCLFLALVLLLALFRQFFLNPSPRFLSISVRAFELTL